MKALRLLGILCIMLFSVVDRSFCYEVSTHEEITKNALEKALQVRNFLADIGYTKDDRITFTFTTYDPYGDLSGNNGTFTNSIIEWMKYGIGKSTVIPRKIAVWIIGSECKCNSIIFSITYIGKKISHL